MTMAPAPSSGSEKWRPARRTRGLVLQKGRERGTQTTAESHPHLCPGPAVTAKDADGGRASDGNAVLRPEQAQLCPPQFALLHNRGQESCPRWGPEDGAVRLARVHPQSRIALQGRPTRLLATPLFLSFAFHYEEDKQKRREHYYKSITD